MGELKRIASASAILVGARVLGMLAGLAAILLMTRQLGLADLGAMLLCMSIAGILSAVASLNVESVAIRHVVRYREAGQTDKIAGFHAFGTALVTGFALLAAGVATLDALGPGYGLFDLFWRYGVFAAPLFSLIRLNGEIVSANGDVLGAVLPRTLLRPALFLIGLLVAGAGAEGLTLEAAILAFHVALALVALLQILVIAPRRLGAAAPSWRTWTRADWSDRRDWVGGGLNLALPYLFIEYSTDLILVAATLALGKEEIAVLGVLLRIVSLHRFATVAIGQAAAPRLAQAWMRQDRPRLDGLLAFIGVTSTVIQLGAVAALAVLGDYVLAIFSPEMAGYRVELVTLALMALIVALFGQTTRMAAIIDLKRFLMGVYAIALGVLALSVAALGSLFGLLGVAAAVPLVWLGWNWAVWRRIRRDAELDVSAPGAFRAWAGQKRTAVAPAPA